MIKSAKKQPAVVITDVFFQYMAKRKVPLFRAFPLFPAKKIIVTPQVALRRVSLTIEKNAVTALLGKNGSGKTSLIKLITGIRNPTEGKIEVFGSPPQSVKNRMGLCLGNNMLYLGMTGRENLEYFGALYGLTSLTKRIDQLAEELNIRTYLDELVENYSFGMKACLAIARSVIHSPELLILDEPTLGIDITMAAHIRNFIKNLKTTVLLTTHYLNEADELAQNVFVIDKGQVLAGGNKKKLLGAAGVPDLTHLFRSLVDVTPPRRKTA